MWYLQIASKAATLLHLVGHGQNNISKSPSMRRVLPLHVLVLTSTANMSKDSVATYRADPCLYPVPKCHIGQQYIRAASQRIWGNILYWNQDQSRDSPPSNVRCLPPHHEKGKSRPKPWAARAWYVSSHQRFSHKRKPANGQQYYT